MPNLGIHDYPSNLKQLYSFDQQVDDFYLDIEFIGDDDDNLNMLVPEHADQFAAFAIDGTGSVMAFWLDNSKLSIYQAPIVYLDSEGGGAVVASSDEEFLSLLPYDTSFFSGAASHWIDYNELPEHTIPPDQWFTEEFYKSKFEYCNDAYPGYQDFRTWLEAEMKIHPVRDPFEIIVKNLKAFPTFPVSY